MQKSQTLIAVKDTSGLIDISGLHGKTKWYVQLCNIMIYECFQYGRGRSGDATFIQVYLALEIWKSSLSSDSCNITRRRWVEGVKEKFYKDVFPGNPTYLHGKVLTVIW